MGQDKLATGPRPVRPSHPEPPRWNAALAGLAVLIVATFATLFNADGARLRLDAQEVARETVQLALQRGSDDPEVRAALIDLRREVYENPLDARTRVNYAALLLSLSFSLDDTRASSFHARVAAEQSPVTVPVVRTAALALIRSGDAEAALELIRAMFDYAPDAAARLLLAAEPMLPPPSMERGLPRQPDAWLSWIRQLRRIGREADADERVGLALANWPSNPAVIEQAAALAVRSGRTSELPGLFPEGLELGSDLGGARLRTYRARARAQAGDRTGAADDLRGAIEIGHKETLVRILAGDAWLAMGETDEARRCWRRAFHGLRPNADFDRRRLLLRLARLESEHGEPGAALRQWREVLRIEPGHAQARSEIARMTGVEP